jgi:hypothetical protein
MIGSDEAADIVAALLAGPWHEAPMRTRVTLQAGILLEPPWVRQLVPVVLRAFPVQPRAIELERFLRAWHPVAELPDPAALARLLDVDDGELAWFADLRSMERRAEAPLRHYRWWTLPKRDGVRLVAAPKPRLKEIQRRLLRHVIAPIAAHPAVHGCHPGRSVRTALQPHVASTVVVRADLESFFASIAATRVTGLLRWAGLRDDVAHLVTGLCTTVAPFEVWRDVPRPADRAAHFRLGRRLATPHLPVGAPTSPALANLVAFALDRRLTGLVTAFGGRYTRYVDDLVFSGGPALRDGRARFVRTLEQIVTDEGFRLVPAKTVVLGAAGRQQLLGAVVNDHPTIPRRDRDNLRALLHNCIQHGPRSQARGRDNFDRHLLGRIAAVGALDPPLGARLRAQFEWIDWSQ